MGEGSILVIGAHPDDEVFGAGGTIARYVQEGKLVSVVTFSYGEKSHIWMKGRYTARLRQKEAETARKMLGYGERVNLGLTEGMFVAEAAEQGTRTELARIIKRVGASRIFTHNWDDPHDDHKAVNRIVLETIEEMKQPCEVFMFDIWNILNLRRLEYPLMYVDISSTFWTKVKALRVFKSQWSTVQWLTMTVLLWSVYSKAVVYGLTHGVRFAERFYKVR